MATSSSLQDKEICSICVCPFTKVKRIKISCPKCDISMCRLCLQRWILSVSTDPMCMNESCKVAYSYEFLSKNLPISWLEKDFKAKRANMFFEREKSLLPATLERLTILRENEQRRFRRNYRFQKITQLRSLENSLESRSREIFCLEFKSLISGLVKKKKDEINVRIQELRESMLTIRKLKDEAVEPSLRSILVQKERVFIEELRIKERSTYTGENRSRVVSDTYKRVLSDGTPISETLKTMVRKTEKIKEKIRLFEIKRKEKDRRDANLSGDDKGSLNERKTRFIMPCIMDGCRGFLSTQYKCGICGVFVCPHCRELKEKEGHTCDPEKVRNVDAIKKETKPCPNCGVPIYKISGCSDMWCWACHTPFNFRTGQIHRSNSNPHFWEWRRLHGQRYGEENALDMCGTSIKGIESLKILPKTGVTVVNIHNLLVHIQRMELLSYNSLDEAVIGETLRERYLTGDITEVYWKRNIYSAHKKNLKNLEIRQAYHAFVEAATAILSRAAHQDERPQLEEKIPEFSKEFEELRAYINGIFSSIMKRYKMTSQLGISPKWTILRGSRISGR